MTVYCVDPALGSDTTGDGSLGNPWATAAVPNSNPSFYYQGGNNIQVKRATRMLPSPAQRFNIVKPVSAGRFKLSYYGDGDTPPIIDGNGFTNNPVWVQGGAGIDIDGLWFTGSASIGCKISATNGNSLDDVTLTNWRAFANGVAGQSGGASTGVIVGREVGGGSVTRIQVTTGVADTNLGHGVKFVGNAQGLVDMVRMTGNGTRNPAHAGGTVGEYMTFSSSPAWTLVSGTTWSIAISALGGAGAGTPTANQNVNDWLVVTAGDNSTIITLALAQLSKSATPTTPGVGEFGINGQNTLLVNLGGPDPRTLYIRAAYSTPVVIFDRCIFERTLDPLGAEGAGCQFDDLSSNCIVRRSIMRDNAGCAFVNYGGRNVRALQNQMLRNAKGGAFSLIGYNMVLNGNRIADNGGPAIQAYKGTITARNNRLLRHAVGFQSNSATEFRITEDANEYMGLATPYLNAAAGAKSRVITKDYRAPRRIRSPQVLVG